MNAHNPSPKTFQFENDGEQVTTTVLVPPEPFVSCRELGYQIIEQKNIPCYSELKLIEQLQNFLYDSIETAEDAHFDEDESVRNPRLDQFSAIFADIQSKKQETEDKKPEVRKQFWETYHELIHSGFLTEPLVSLENSFSAAIADMIACRNQAIGDMSTRQSQEMDRMLKTIGVKATEQDVNKLSLQHFEQADKQRKFWKESIGDLKKSQKAEFCEWIEKVHEDIQQDMDSKDKIVKRIRSRAESSSLTRAGDWEITSMSASISSDDISQAMDESFTINLGAQMKTTHNLRLTSTNVLNICRNMTTSVTPTPQRIQTAMSLYSNSLTGLVLLVDNRVNNYTGIKKEFSDICEQSADFHFPSFEEQLDDIRQHVSKTNPAGNLQVGDFYVTKHSNLSQVHVVFHLVSDESVLSADINSRHSIMLGLRNVLKTAYMSDVCTFSMPLLLSYEMTDNMTLQWCLKRAELVFKCVKGFMIEMASLSPVAVDNRTLQFVVPENISEELFSNLANMLPSIFRLSNPLVLSESV